MSPDKAADVSADASSDESADTCSEMNLNIEFFDRVGTDWVYVIPKDVYLDNFIIYHHFLQCPPKIARNDHYLWLTDSFFF